MSEVSSPSNVETVERQWLDDVQRECNAAPRPPGDRPATQQELEFFWRGLDALERYCAATQPTAEQFVALGRPALAAKLAAVLADINGARAAFDAPPRTDAGPVTTKMQQLFAEQRAVGELEIRAMQLVLTNPAAAEPMLIEAQQRAERNFIDQEETLQRLPDGPSHIPELRAARLERTVSNTFALGMTAARTGRPADARTLYDQAVAQSANLAPDARARAEVTRTTLAALLGIWP
jgi:hypothetical protein